jgi:mono/diheme cytochrome c family protein
MPQYPDYTAEQISDLAAYIHYLRQKGRYQELTAPGEASAGDAQAGAVYFSGTGKCASCHSLSGDLAGVAAKYKAEILRQRLLRPGPDFVSEGAAPGIVAHLKWLERYSDADVRNVLAYLQAAK